MAPKIAAGPMTAEERWRRDWPKEGAGVAHWKVR